MKSLDDKSSMVLFNEGKDLFNKGELYEAHLKWEHIWKYGDNDSRKNIKGFIQMSGGLLKQSFGKQRAAEYLMEKAKNNIMKSQMFSNEVNIRNIVKQINECIVLTQDGVCCVSSVTISI